MKSTYHAKRVALEGCSSEWAQERYLPALAGRASRDEIDLWAIDIRPQIALGPNLTDLWDAAESLGCAHYVDKTRGYVDTPDANVVFILTPDRLHCETARFWLDRMASGGRIYIEKPLDASMESALKLKAKIDETGKKDTVFAFDHYLARACPFLQSQEEHLSQIGAVERVEFSILESFGIPPYRVGSLDRGMIFDLLCHVLAIVSALVETNSIPSPESLQTVALLDVKGAQYVGCPIRGETFAKLDLLIGGVRVRAVMGKDVDEDKKEMRILGSKGSVTLDFIQDRFMIFDRVGNTKGNGELNPQHVEGFIGEALREKNSALPSGTFTFEAALEILRIMDRAKSQLGIMPLYKPGSSADEILKILS